MIFLDANVVIDAMDTRRPQVRLRLGEAQLAGVALALSSVAYFKSRTGCAMSSRRAENERALAAVLNGGIDIVPFDAQDAAEACEIRANLRRVGQSIGPYDLMIAGQTRRRGATLVTHNRKEFARVAGLTTLDWVE